MNYECISYVTVYRDSERIIEYISKKLEKYKLNKSDITIVDATACVGCDTISFCNNFDVVIPIELDVNRYSDLLHNLETYDVKNAYPVNGNCLEKIDEITINIDIIYFDPPWGGSEYKLKDKISLKIGNVELVDVVAKYIDRVKMIVLKLPKNFDYDNFLPKLEKYKMSIHKDIKKIDVVIIEK
jgi:16S rRNA G966 N2-methylase RsmD